MKQLAWPIAASLAVVLLPPILILATGRSWFDLLVLFGVFVLAWALTRLSRREMGLRIGSRRAYLLALGYPLAVTALLAFVAMIFGQVSIEGSAPGIALGVLTMFAGTAVGVLLTEEGFFRGWLWGSLEKGSVGTTGILLWTSVAFFLWHVPTATIEPEYRPPAGVVPVYLANVIVLGLTWGLVRLLSGSIIVASFCHAAWNALVYEFFKYGGKTGSLGIDDFHIFDPERGWVGLGLNLIILVSLWRWWKRRETPAAST